MINVVVRRYV